MKKYYKILNILFYLELILGVGTLLLVYLAKIVPFVPNPNFAVLELTARSVFDIAIYFLLMTTSLAILIFYVFINKKDISLLNLSFFIIISATWNAFASGVPLAVFKNQLMFELFYGLAFIVGPVPFLLYIIKITKNNKQLLMINCSVLIAIALFGLIWLLANNFTFPNVLWLFHIALVITLLVSLYVLVYDFIKHKNENNKIIIFGLVVFIATCIINIIGYYVFTSKLYTVFMSIGLIFFIISLIMVGIKNILKEMVAVKNFEKIVSEIPSGIFKAKVDENMTLIYANTFYYELFGYEAGDSADGFTSACMPFDNKDELKEKCRQYILQGIDNFELEATAKNRNGAIINLLLNLHYNALSNHVIGTVFNVTKRKEFENKLIVAEEEYQIVSRHISHMIFRYEVQSRLLYLPEAFANRYNLEKCNYEFFSRELYKDLVSDISILDFKKLCNDMLNGEKTGGAIIKINELKGGESWWDITYETIFDNDNVQKLVVIICQDITDLREKELAYIKWMQEIAAIPKQKMYLIEWNLTQDILDTERGGISQDLRDCDANTAFNIKMKKYAEDNIFASDRPIFIQKTNREFLLEQYNKGNNSFNFEFREISSETKTPRWVSLSIQLIPYPHTTDIKGYFLFRDVDREKTETLDLKHRANKDALTGLLNRNSFIEKFTSAINSQSGNENNKYLLIIDIDNFKDVNDNHGHFIGDKFLLEIASILISQQKKGDYVGRLGGDEFLMLLKNEKDIKSLINTLNNIIKSLNVDIGGVKITCSIGVVSYPDNGDNFDVIYEKADIALYKAKKSGRNKFCLVDSCNV